MADDDKGDMPGLADILALEDAVWQALLTGDAAADSQLLLPEFLGVYPSGFAGRADHAGQLDDGPSVESYTLSQARLLPVGRDHVMLCYRADYCWVGEAKDAAMYISSLWMRTPEGWRNLFSQDTPVSDTPVP